MGIVIKCHQNSNKSKTKLLAILGGVSTALVTTWLLLYATLSIGPQVSGDSAIYFVFLRDFFIAPFTFGNEVSHGATSPLWVIIHVIPFQVFGLMNWTKFALVTNAGLIVISLAVFSETMSKKFRISRTVGFTFISSYLFVASPLFTAAAQLTEAPLSIFFLSLQFHSLMNHRVPRAMLIGGLLTLVRPELFFCGLLLLFLLKVSDKATLKKKLKNASGHFFCLMLFPTMIYGYLALQTGVLIPTSISARALTADEYGVNWFTEIIKILESFSITNFYFLIAVFAIFIQTVYLAFNFTNISPARLFSVSGLPLVVGLLMNPTSQYYARYAIPLIAFSIPTLLFLMKLLTSMNRKIINESIKIFICVGCIFVMGFVTQSSSNISFIKASEVAWDWILLGELENVGKDLKWNSETVVLNYEIQGQWSTNASMISMDGIVGRGEIFGVLNGDDSFRSFLIEFNVGYIVTMNALKYRPIFERSDLGKIFEHDFFYDVGSQIQIDGVTFLKVATNECLMNNDCYLASDGQRYLSTRYEALSGNSLAWNSVYKVVLNVP